MEEDTRTIPGGSVVDTWRKHGGESHDFCKSIRRSIRESLGMETACKETQIVSP
jgi:hypothetical protein